MRRTLLLPAALLVLPAVLLLLVPAQGLRAQSAREIDKRVIAITDQLRCPTCQGISVRDSEASFSQEIKAKVRRMVEEGQSDAQIKAYFVSRYGEWILRAPPKHGLGLVVWLLPGLAIAAAGALIGYRLYRSTRQGEDEPGEGGASQSDLTPEQLARIERDLKRYEDLD